MKKSAYHRPDGAIGRKELHRRALQAVIAQIGDPNELSRMVTVVIETVLAATHQEPCSLVHPGGSLCVRCGGRGWVTVLPILVEEVENHSDSPYQGKGAPYEVIVIEPYGECGDRWPAYSSDRMYVFRDEVLRLVRRAVVSYGAWVPFDPENTREMADSVTLRVLTALITGEQ